MYIYVNNALRCLEMSVSQVQQAQERLARGVKVSKDRMPELLQRIRQRLKAAKQKEHFTRFTQPLRERALFYSSYS